MRWIAMKFGRIFHVTVKMNCYNLADPLNFQLALSPGTLVYDQIRAKQLTLAELCV